MSRIINPDSAGKERNRMVKAIVIAVRELAQQTGPGDESRDLAAFIALALHLIAETIDISVAAWEKRGYWIKADRFRMDWAWSGLFADKMRLAVLNEDWGTIARLAAQIAEKLGSVKVSERHRFGAPWVGAWQRLKGQE